jgi:hypothetical protein
LISKVNGRERIFAMSDQLGNLMYDKDNDEMWELWKTFQRTWCDEPLFLTYVKNE